MAIIGLIGQNCVGKSTVAKIIQYLMAEKNQNKYTDYSKITFSIYEFLEGKDVYDTIHKSFYSYTNSISEDSKWQIKKFATGVNECYKIIAGIDFHSLNREDKEKERPKFIEFAESCKKIFGKDVWAKREFKDYNSESNIIFDDVRFYEEKREIDLRNGLLIEIFKEPDNISMSAKYYIINDGTIEDLIEKIKQVLIKEKLL
jgi:energy-coupling factor transporter ATP-binding protein EcfA2